MIGKEEIKTILTNEKTVIDQIGSEIGDGEEVFVRMRSWKSDEEYPGRIKEEEYPFEGNRRNILLMTMSVDGRRGMGWKAKRMKGGMLHSAQ